MSRRGRDGKVFEEEQSQPESQLSPAGSEAKRGGFYASQDSDVGAGDDGSFYTWTVEELRAAGACGTPRPPAQTSLTAPAAGR
jgi:hypothetical protein